MYQFSAIVTNDYTIEVTSNTYWSCKAEGNFKLSQYDGSGDTKINIEIPDDVMLAEGTVYFSYGDERCKYPKFEVSLANLCYITSYPNYNTCDDNGTKKKTVYFFYDEPLETFNLSVFCYDGWTVDSSASDFNYITSNNEVMIIASGNDGELRIIPNHQCDGKNIIYAKLMKIPEIEVAVKSVSINKDSITLIINKTQTLTATVYPYNATNKQVRWSTSDSNIATVGQNGIVTAKAIGNCTITVTTEDGGYTDECSVKVISTPTGDYVEIGGIKWATKNVGAESITSMGLYFQWGDTQGYTADQVGSGEGQKYFLWSDYKFNPSGDGETMTKYNSTDGLTTLQPSDDAVTAALGGDWRMPTKEEFEALSAAVNTEWVTNYQGSGVNGGLMTDKTDSSKVLFFPACGYVMGGSIHYVYSSYWNSSLVDDYVKRAHNLRFNSDNFFWNYYNFRYQGLQIRGIFTGNTINVTNISLTENDITLEKNKTKQLYFSVTPANASRNVIWESSNENVATVSQNGLVTALSEGNCTITVTAVYGGVSDTCTVTVTLSPPPPTVDYIEIGGIKWATKNVGAENITDVGLYFQWGDTQGYTSDQIGSIGGKKYFGWPDYKYCNGTSSVMTKYNSTDGLTTLASEDDAASVVLGSGWRMPTKDEYTTLNNTTTTAWTTDYQGSGTKGIIYTDKTDSSKVLFFPAGGEAFEGNLGFKGSEGYYWSASLYPENINNAFSSYFKNSIVQNLVPTRCRGFLIRPVKNQSFTDPKFTLTYTDKPTFTYYCDGDDWLTQDNVKSNGNYEKITTAVIGDCVRVVMPSAFSGCTALMDVEISNKKVERLSDSAFTDCTSLISCTLGEKVMAIDKYCFAYCTNLSNINFPSSLTAIGERCFAWCSSLTGVTFLENFRELNAGAFYHCDGLKTVNMSRSKIELIGVDTFSGCTSLTSVTMPNTVTEIRDRSFHDCASLTSITISNKVVSIGLAAFERCGDLTEIKFTSTDISIINELNIVDGAFPYKDNLKILVPRDYVSYYERPLSKFKYCEIVPY